jgi:hypothetical protein
MTKLELLSGKGHVDIRLMAEACQILFSMANKSGLLGTKLSKLQFNYKPANPNDPLDNDIYCFTCEIDEEPVKEEECKITPKDQARGSFFSRITGRN